MVFHVGYTFAEVAKGAIPAMRSSLIFLIAVMHALIALDAMSKEPAAGPLSDSLAVPETNVTGQRRLDIAQVVWSSYYTAALTDNPEQVPLQYLASTDPMSYRKVVAGIDSGKTIYESLYELRSLRAETRTRTEWEGRERVLDLVERLPPSVSDSQFVEGVNRWLSTQEDIVESLAKSAYSAAIESGTSDANVSAVKDALARIGPKLPTATKDLNDALLNGNSALAGILDQAGATEEIVQAVREGTTTAIQVSQEVERLSRISPGLAHTAIASVADQIRESKAGRDLRAARQFSDQMRSAIALFGAVGQLTGMRDVDLFLAVANQAVNAYQAIASMTATGATFGGVGAVVGAAAGIALAFKNRSSSGAEDATAEMMRALFTQLLDLKRMVVTVSRQVAAVEAALVELTASTNSRLDTLELEIADLRSMSAEGFSDVRKAQITILRQDALAAYLSILNTAGDQQGQLDGISRRIKEHMSVIEQYGTDTARRPPFILSGDRNDEAWTLALAQWPTDDLSAYLPAALGEAGLPGWGQPIAVAESGNWLLSARREVGDIISGPDTNIHNVCSVTSSYCGALERADDAIPGALSSYVLVAKGVIGEIDEVIETSNKLEAFKPNAELSDTQVPPTILASLVISPETARAMFSMSVPEILIPRIEQVGAKRTESYTTDSPRQESLPTEIGTPINGGPQLRTRWWIFDGCVERTSTAYAGFGQTAEKNEQGLKRIRGVPVADLGTFRYCFTSNPLRAPTRKGVMAALDEAWYESTQNYRYKRPQYVPPSASIAGRRDFTVNAQRVAAEGIVMASSGALRRAGILADNGEEYDDRFVKGFIEHGSASIGDGYCWRVGTTYLRFGPTWRVALGADVNAKAVPNGVAYTIRAVSKTFTRDNSHAFAGLSTREQCVRRGHSYGQDSDWLEVDIHSILELNEEERERRILLVRALLILHNKWSGEAVAELNRRLADPRSQLSQLAGELTRQSNVLQTLGKFAWSTCEGPGQIEAAVQIPTSSTRQLMAQDKPAVLSGSFLRSLTSAAEIVRYRSRLAALVAASEHPDAVEAGKTCSAYVPNDLRRFVERANSVATRSGWISDTACRCKAIE